MENEGAPPRDVAEMGVNSCIRDVAMVVLAFIFFNK